MKGCLGTFFAAAAMAAASVPAIAGDLTVGEIGDELVGRQIVWWEDGGWQGGHLLLLPDGTAEISVDRPTRQGDTGRWAFRGDQLCTTWSGLRSGMEKCYRLQRSERGRFLTSGGNVFEVREAGV